MKTVKKDQAPKELKDTLNPEQLMKWVENDLEAAISFLHIIRLNPRIMAMIQEELIAADKQRKGQI